ncbi:hypothetical protein OIU84_003575 [Salix udensis]|uniref:non-specific serine/threonine protein kinase n=1 Tax=Salix udensis TaxID=889485 RepID=A0AAD6K266_9ROSI|nr:hypothetical protein OIU84_003575 [Salix udensis]
MPSRHLSTGFDHPRPSFLTKTRILFLTLTISASVVLILTILYFVYHLWHTLVNRSRTIPFDASAPLKLQRFSYKELRIATNDFDDANIIGKGGSATVFRGIARDGKLYAIKRIDALSLQSEREFQNELQILGGLRSPFLVILLGYCVEKNKRLLVYDQDLGKSQELWKSQELSGNLTPETPAIGTPVESCHEALNLSSLNYNANIAGESDVKVGNGKGKEVSSVDIGGDDWNCRFVPYDDEFCSNDHSKELNCNSSSVVDDSASSKQWGKDWWWRQDGSGELCSKDYVMEWIGSQICPSANPDWEDEKKSTQERTESRRSVALDKLADANEPPRLKDFKFENLVSGFEKKETKCRKNRRKKNRKMQEWWKEEHLDEINKKGSKLKNLETKVEKRV